MPTVPSRRLVVDASILRAVSDGRHPTPSACRAALMAVRDHAHRVCDTPAIRDEWNRHQSAFARKWRGAMHARGWIVQVTPADTAALEKRVATHRAATAGSQSAVAKDLHLIAAALAADRIVLSADGALLAAIRPLKLDPLRGLVWANPVIARDQVLGFLGAATPAPGEWLLHQRPGDAPRKL